MGVETSARASRVLDLFVEEHTRIVDGALDEAHDVSHVTGVAHSVRLRGDGQVEIACDPSRGDDCEPSVLIDILT